LFVGAKMNPERGRSIMKTIPRLVWIVPAVLLVIAVAPIPYGYYTFARIVTCGAATLIAVVGFRDRLVQAWSILMVAIAVLFNPILPIQLDRAIWFYLDLVAAAVFVSHLVMVREWSAQKAFR